MRYYFYVLRWRKNHKFPPLEPPTIVCLFITPPPLAHLQITLSSSLLGEKWQNTYLTCINLLKFEIFPQNGSHQRMIRIHDQSEKKKLQINFFNLSREVTRLNAEQRAGQKEGKENMYIVTQWHANRMNEQ